MAGYIGSKAVLLSTTAAVVTGDMTVAGATTLSGAFTSLGIDDNATSTAITIDASENVGIGTASPSAQLHQRNNTSGINAIVENTTNNTRLQILSTGLGKNSELWFGDGADDDVGRIDYDHGNDSLSLYTNAAERLRIDSSGNVGIGVTDPDSALEVQSSASGLNSVHLSNTSSAGYGAKFVGGGTTATQYIADFRDYAGASKVKIDGSGNVGIGTAAPTANLHVKFDGTDNLSGVLIEGTESGSVSAPDLALYKNSTSPADGDIVGALWFYGNDSAANSTLYAGILARSSDVTSGTEDGSLSFIVAGAGSSSTAMTIDGSGNVLVGKTVTTGGVAGIQFDQSGKIHTDRAGVSLDLNRMTSNGAVVSIRRSNTEVGTISVTGSATAYNTSSDYRLKENVTPIQGAADTVMAMQPCTYTAIADGLWYDGFLAHELQEVHPRAVQGTKDAMMDEEYEVTPAVYEDVVTPAVDAVAATYDDEGLELTPAVEAVPETTESTLVTEAVTGTRSVPDLQGVDYSKLTPILTAALQEALTEIAALKVRVAALEATP